MKKQHLVEFLLERGAIQHIQNPEGKDACDYAKDNGLADSMRQFLNCGITKKKDAMHELKMLQNQNGSKMEASYKKSTRSGSIATRRRST